MRTRSVPSEPMHPRLFIWASAGILLWAACTNTEFQFLLELMIYMGAVVVFRQPRLRVPVASRSV